MSTKDARKNKNAQFGKQQDILPLPHISAKTLFEDKQEAENDIICFIIMVRKTAANLNMYCLNLHI